MSSQPEETKQKIKTGHFLVFKLISHHTSSSAAYFYAVFYELFESVYKLYFKRILRVVLDYKQTQQILNYSNLKMTK